ncbi:unnamed protein product [Protopolystoma xenopodis]|uniref:Uncharacterized protein n=1 Tax=Protopolystoma xenopodis TaxID=117903 RepID=A0A3S5AFL6_9PLAT|nr:unnamed protein product [Protopolystoma xenopodis]
MDLVFLFFSSSSSSSSLFNFPPIQCCLCWAFARVRVTFLTGKAAPTSHVTMRYSTHNSNEITTLSKAME